jgi:hypothetical protein
MKLSDALAQSPTGTAEGQVQGIYKTTVKRTSDGKYAAAIYLAEGEWERKMFDALPALEEYLVHWQHVDVEDPQGRLIYDTFSLDALEPA